MNIRKDLFSRVITIFLKIWGPSVQVGIGLKRSYKFFEPFLYCKKSMEILLNFWPIGAGSLKWGRLAGFL